MNLLKIISSCHILGIRNEKVASIEWLEIPYAKPAIVDFRWKSSQDPENWENILETQAFIRISIQLNGKKISGSEDCLYLNVFRSNQESVKLPASVYSTEETTKLDQDNNLNEVSLHQKRIQ
jgi:para-nitrobenzyl esterase